MTIPSTYHAKWGGAAVSETFSVRTGIGVKVRKGPNGQIAEMLIFRMHADSDAAEEYDVQHEIAKNVLDELLPASGRGKFVIGGFVDAFCMPENDCAGSGRDTSEIRTGSNSVAGFLSSSRPA